MRFKCQIATILKNHEYVLSVWGHSWFHFLLNSNSRVIRDVTMIQRDFMLSLQFQDIEVLDKT